jgi:peroxiredoxin
MDSIDFEVESTNGKIKLSNVLKEKDFVVLYFYPKHLLADVHKS